MHDTLFRVSTTLAPRASGFFFLAGDLIAGEVRPGMVVNTAFGFQEPIQVIERMEHDAQIALGFLHANTAELARWTSHPWPGTTLRIPPQPILHPCPCCGMRTMMEEARGSYEICDVCGWEDDYVQYHHPDYRGGANTESLNEARTAFFAAHPHAPRHHD